MQETREALIRERKDETSDLIKIELMDEVLDDALEEIWREVMRETARTFITGMIKKVSKKRMKGGFNFDRF